LNFGISDTFSPEEIVAPKFSRLISDSVRFTRND
jgi:hypothetical protein